MLFTADEALCRDIDEALEYEWLETNGRGAFASSTILGTNTRRYHCLFSAALKPPRHRVIFVNKVEEMLTIDGNEYPLSTNLYSDAVYPPGYLFLERFSLSPFPTWEYNFDGVRLRKTMFLAHHQDTAVIRYYLPTPDLIGGMNVRLLCTLRDIHETIERDKNLEPRVTHDVGCSTIQGRGYPPLRVYHNFETVDEEMYWYNQMYYPKDERRGFEAREDLISPFALERQPDPLKREYFIALTLDGGDAPNPYHLEKFERRRRYHLTAETVSAVRRRSPAMGSGHPAPLLNDEETQQVYRFYRKGETVHIPDDKTDLLRLCDAARHFLVTTHSGEPDLMAGYPWLGVWGRDTMIAMEGLLLCTGNYTAARQLLCKYAGLSTEGITPSLMPDLADIPQYTGVDTSLWFIHACWAYWQHTGDLGVFQEMLFEVLVNIIDHIQDGIEDVVSMDEDDHLLQLAGVGGTLRQTYGNVDKRDFRQGKTIGVNALWFHALSVVERIAQALGDQTTESRIMDLLSAVEASLDGLFWDDDKQRMADFVTTDGQRSFGLRAQHLLAIGLPHSAFDIGIRNTVLSQVENELLVPLGIRSLSPKSPGYIPHFHDEVRSGERAYNNGAVWPWMLGYYVDACRSAFMEDANLERMLRAAIQPTLDAMRSREVASIREMLDGTAPHRAHGCIAMAKNAGEMLRALHNIEHLHLSESSL